MRVFKALTDGGFSPWVSPGRHYKLLREVATLKGIIGYTLRVPVNEDGVDLDIGLFFYPHEVEEVI